MEGVALALAEEQKKQEKVIADVVLNVSSSFGFIWNMVEPHVIEIWRGYL